jgi:hypothetical protein
MHREGFRCQEETTFDREGDRRSQPFSVRTQPHSSLALIHLIKWTWDNAHAASGVPRSQQGCEYVGKAFCLREKSQNYCIETWASMTRYIKHFSLQFCRSHQNTHLSQINPFPRSAQQSSASPSLRSCFVSSVLLL